MNRFFRSALFPLIIIAALVWLALQTLGGGGTKSTAWTTSQAYQAVRDNPSSIDQVTVDRAVHGDQVPLQPGEQQAALRRLAGQHSDDEIGRRLGVATRTVVRRRTSQGLPAYAPVPPIDGPSR